MPEGSSIVPCIALESSPDCLREASRSARVARENTQQAKRPRHESAGDGAGVLCRMPDLVRQRWLTAWWMCRPCVDDESGATSTDESPLVPLDRKSIHSRPKEGKS